MLCSQDHAGSSVLLRAGAGLHCCVKSGVLACQLGAARLGVALSIGLAMAVMKWSFPNELGQVVSCSVIPSGRGCC